MARILLADDDRKLLALLERGFRYEGFDVSTALTGEQCLTLAHNQRPDAVVLDIGMPGLNGFDVCRLLHSQLDVPVIMLTARDEVEDKVHAFDLGADDYVTKPFAFDELLARIRVVMRRRSSVHVDRLTFADVACDVAARDVRRGDRLVPLTARELDLLMCFLRNPRQVLTREVLLENVWGYEFSGDIKVVDVYVGYLRQKLGEPRLIHTVRGVGYALRL